MRENSEVAFASTPRRYSRPQNRVRLARFYCIARSSRSGAGLRGLPPLPWMVEIATLLVAATLSAHPAAAQNRPAPNADLLLTAVDENGVAIPAVRVSLILSGGAPGPPTLKCETDYAGRCEFHNLEPGFYRLRAEKEGFYAFMQERAKVGEAQRLEITLNHQQEFIQQVNVVYSPPAIDPAQISSSGSLSSHEIIDLPYAVTRDIRYALPMIPGVLQDAFGQLHVNGSDSRQSFEQIDGFNSNAVASGAFTMRVNVDAVRSAEVEGSRYPAEYGKGSGGVISLRTGMGDDHFRFSGTDFLPSIQDRKGALHWNSWTPRAAISGPLRKRRAWFLLAPDGEYNVHIVNELPRGADESSNWRASGLAKAQTNLTPGNILTASVLVNRFRSFHSGLSRFNPQETTVDLDQTANLFSLKDQALLAHGMLLDVGIAESQFLSGLRPMGDQTYVITPDTTRGNFFESSRGRSRRVEGIANLVLPPPYWHGRHEIKIGTDVDRLVYHQSYDRHPFLVVRENGTLARKGTFVGSPFFQLNNVEVSGYVQDRWSPSERLLIEPGLRFDWDEIVRDVLVSPRLGATYMLGSSGNTKLVGGIGIYYDATSLQILSDPLSGSRLDYFYDQSGLNLLGPPVQTMFQSNPNLKAPRFINWSAGIDRKLPGSIYVSAEYVQKRGHHGLTFINQCGVQNNCFSGILKLENARRDKYDAVTVKMRRTFKQDHVVFASYTRSSARSNAVLDFSLENPTFSQQAGGPLPWDVPNRFLSWGFLPLARRIDLAYLLDWRDGFPFSLVNENQQLVGPPGSQRFPYYFSLNLALERRIVLFGYQWALRAGFDDITNRHNPFAVDNNVDSPHFRTFSAEQGRALTARIRLVGRK